MDRIAEQVADIEETIAKLRTDIDAILTAIKNAENGAVSPPHAIYWRQLVDSLTSLVLDADERFHSQIAQPDGGNLTQDRQSS